MSSSVLISSENLSYRITPPVFEGESIKGTAGIFFFSGSYLIYNRLIDVSKTLSEKKTIYKVTDVIRGITISTSFEFVAQEPENHTYRYDKGQIKDATNEAIKILRERQKTQFVI
jgi:hypothetical protein